MTSNRYSVFGGLFLLSVAVVLFYSLEKDSIDSVTTSFSISEEILQSDSQEFAFVTEPREFQFPEDHGPHMEYRTEWWYFTGNVTAANGNRYGYQFTVFRQASGNKELKTGSEWETDQMYMGHLALTDVNRMNFYSEERFARGGLGLAQASASPFSAQIDSWSAKGRSIPDCEGCLELSIQATGDNFSIDLDLRSIKPVVYQGDQGFSQKGETEGNASYYYSLTRMETTGEVTIDGTGNPVSGLSWMDHEWSTSALGNELVGWDWVSLHLDDGRDLMYYQLRKKDGTAFLTSEGTLVDENGNSTRLMRENVKFEPIRKWKSSKTNIEYPVAWTLAVPGDELSLKVVPVVDDQEHENIFQYWEGAVTVEGTSNNQRIEGTGYLELVGYE